MSIPVPIYLCRFTIIPGMEVIAISQISEATKPDDRPAVIRDWIQWAIKQNVHIRIETDPKKIQCKG